MYQKRFLHQRRIVKGLDGSFVDLIHLVAGELRRHPTVMRFFLPADKRYSLSDTVPLALAFSKRFPFTRASRTDLSCRCRWQMGVLTCGQYPPCPVPHLVKLGAKQCLDCKTCNLMWNSRCISKSVGSVEVQKCINLPKALKSNFERHISHQSLKKSKEAFAFNLFLIINENIDHYRYAFAEIVVTLLCFMFWKEKKLKASYFEKKLAF